MGKIFFLNPLQCNIVRSTFLFHRIQPNTAMKRFDNTKDKLIVMIREMVFISIVPQALKGIIRLRDMPVFRLLKVNQPKIVTV